jgi:hypothetical protein
MGFTRHLVGNHIDQKLLFADLWRDTQEELARASGHPGLLQGTVAYRLKLERLDAGEYSWNNGAPTIRLYRPWNLPQNLEQPDLITRPVEDACTLAHERGHFISDPTGHRSQLAYTTWRHGAQLTPEHQVLILEEERRAWQHARAILTELGWLDWAAFEAIRWRLLRGYSEGLSPQHA